MPITTHAFDRPATFTPPPWCDAGLPGLPHALCADGFAERLRQAAPNQQIEAVRLRYIRYKPGEHCLAHYQVQLSQGEVSWYAHAYARTRWEKHACRRTEALGSEILSDDELRILWRRFPHDPELRIAPWLSSDAASPRRRARLIATNAGELTEPAQVLAYKPERRCVLSLNFGAVQAVWRVYARERFAQALANARQLRGSSDIVVPELLGKSRRHRTLALSWLAGEPLRCGSPGSAEEAELLARLGCGLRSLHGAVPPPADAPPLGAAPSRSAALLTGLRYLLPRETARLEELTRLFATQSMTAHRAPVWCHGDLATDQLLLTDSQLALVDWDAAEWNDPLVDLASLAADLISRQLRHSAADPDLDLSRFATLLSGYGLHSAGDWQDFRVRTAAALLMRSHEPFRRAEVNWEESTGRILDCCQQLLPRGAARGTGVARCESSLDESLPALPAARDPAVAADRLGQVVELVPWIRDRQLQEVTLLRHKRGRRCLLAYDWSPRQPQNGAGPLDPEPGLPCRVVAKMRCHRKGVDERTYRLQEQLWKRGFSPQASDKIVVAQPLGMLPEWDLWLQAWVPGRTVTDCLLSGGPADTLGARVGTALVKLQAAPVAMDRMHTMDDELAILAQRLETLVASNPAHGPLARQVLRHCEALAPLLDASPQGLIHRDFYPDQILLAGPRTVLLDLDLASHGAAAIDIGNFLAHLTELGLRYPAVRQRVRLTAASLRQQYHALRPEVSAAAIRGAELLAAARLWPLSQTLPGRAMTTGLWSQWLRRELRSSRAWLDRTPG